MVPAVNSMVRKSSKALQLHLYGSGENLYGTEVLQSSGTASLWFRPSTLWSESPPKHRNCISMVPAVNCMVRNSPKAPELRLYGSDSQLYGPEVLQSTATSSLWFRRETPWSGSPPGHWNCISMVLERNSMVRISSKAPELRLYGSDRQLYGPKVLQRTGTPYLCFRRETLWSGSPPEHWNCISMVLAVNSMVQKSSKAPELNLYGSGEKLYSPEVLHSNLTPSLWFRRETLWHGSPPKHRNCISMVPAVNSMVRKSSKALELHLYGSGRQLYGPKVLHSTGTASLWFRSSTLWSESPPQHWNCISMIQTVNSMVRKSSKGPELHLYGSSRQLHGPEVLHSTGTESLWFRLSTLWSKSPPKHRNCISMVPERNSMVQKSSTAPELHLYGSGRQLDGPKVLHSNVTPSLWFRRETRWHGSPPKHWNSVSMVPSINSMIRKSSKGPELHLNGSGRQLYGPKVPQCTGTTSL